MSNKTVGANNDILEKIRHIIQFQSPDTWKHSRIVDLPDLREAAVTIEQLRIREEVLTNMATQLKAMLDEALKENRQLRAIVTNEERGL